MENEVRCKKYAVYSNQNCITTLLVEMIRGEMAEILLDNILRLFSTETFGKDKSAYYVGGEKKLMNLIEAGKIVISPLMSKTASGIVMLLKYYFIADVREGKLNLKNGRNEKD